MDIREFAKNYFNLVSNHDYESCLKLKSDDIVSIEAQPGETQVSKGIDQVRQKNAWWEENFEVHSINSTGPFPNGNQFTIVFEMDTTFKPEGKRETMKEVALYTVENDKIVEEKFFYDYV